MADARISTPTCPINKVVGTGNVPTSFSVAKHQPSTTKPVTDTERLVIYDQSASMYGVTALAPDCSLLNIMPYSSVNNSTSVGIRVIGWRYYIVSKDTTLWLPTVLYDGTLSYTSSANIPQLPSSTVETAAQYLFSGLTSNGWAPAPSSFSPASGAAANDAVAMLTVDPVGSTLVTVSYKAATNVGTMGALWSTI